MTAPDYAELRRLAEAAKDHKWLTILALLDERDRLLDLLARAYDIATSGMPAQDVPGEIAALLVEEGDAAVARADGLHAMVMDEAAELGLEWRDYKGVVPGDFKALIRHFKARQATLAAERDRMRVALEHVEWEGWLGDDEVGCATCDSLTRYDPVTGVRSGTHHRDCIVGRALGRPECGGGS